MPKYDNKNYNAFVRDMEASDFITEDYHGRFYYHGPAVRVRDRDELQDVMSSTRVRLQWDNLGLGYIVYPR